ncbi:MAG: DUF4240 domain-containing protein [Ignavibacteriae bacterium]|nr:MAG: DUF4240 domain-containing protein [Ignavibacteriota bacterium]
MKIEEICAVHVSGWTDKITKDIKEYLGKPLLITDIQMRSFHREIIGVLLNYIDRWLWPKYSVEQRSLMLNTILCLTLEQFKPAGINNAKVFKEFLLKNNSKWWLRDMVGITDGGLFADVAKHIYKLSNGPRLDHLELQKIKIYFRQVYKEITQEIAAAENKYLACKPEEDTMIMEPIFDQIEKCELSIDLDRKTENVKTELFPEDENGKESQTIGLDKLLEILNEEKKFVMNKYASIGKAMSTEVLDQLTVLAYKTTLQRLKECSDKLPGSHIFYKSENREEYEMLLFEKLQGEYVCGVYNKVRCPDLGDRSGNIILSTSVRIKKEYFPTEPELTIEEISKIILTKEGIYHNLKQQNNEIEQQGPVKVFVKTCADRKMINRADFWSLIELIDKSALSDGDEEKAAVRLIRALKKFSEPELRSFDSHLEEVLSDIGGDEYAKDAGISGESDDGFRYLRQYVVAQGQNFYEQVKNNPDAIPNSEDCWFEYLDLIAPEVWSKKTKRKLEEWYQEGIERMK